MILTKIHIFEHNRNNYFIIESSDSRKDDEYTIIETTVRYHR